MNAPYQRITTSALRFATTRYFKEARIDISGKKHGPHTFRSSLASSMVNDDIPYEIMNAHGEVNITARTVLCVFR
ncbi:hypothetical protein [Desulfosporosinus sp.]|uniref:hypothetical protein n=1 Tax=Desulfosporosinus sp. TaxID=157907 RepID=UPI0026034810|nr:hypothetical protein [Desulfosporosinus sp.]